MMTDLMGVKATWMDGRRPVSGVIRGVRVTDIYWKLLVELDDGTLVDRNVQDGVKVVP